MVHNAHRRRSKLPIVRLRYPNLDRIVMILASDCQQAIEIAAQCCWCSSFDETDNYVSLARYDIRALGLRVSPAASEGRQSFYD